MTLEEFIATLRDENKTEMILDLLCMLSGISKGTIPHPPPGSPSDICRGYCIVKAQRLEAEILADEVISKAMN